MNRQTYILYYVAWLQAILAMLCSLFLSQIMQYTPCVLCWYQRILMYPIVVILGVAMIRKDRGAPYYVLPLSLLGMAFALYHYLLQRGVIPDRFAPCATGVSCTTRFVEWFGFVTIPLLSLLAFTIVSVAMWLVIKKGLKHE